MTSRDLTGEQLYLLKRATERHLDYYLRAYRHAQAAGMPWEDPLVQAICEAWNGVASVARLIEHLESRLPRPYRPLVEPWKTSGLAARELPWAERQRRAAEEHARHEREPSP